MKKTVFIFIILQSFIINAQVTVHGINKGNYSALLDAKTYFVVPEFDTQKIEEYKIILKNIWTFNPLIVITTAEAHKIDFNDESVARIALSAITYSFYSSTSSNTVVKDIKYHYTISKKKSLFLAAELWFTSLSNIELDKLDYVSNNGFCNYSLGTLKNFMQALNSSMLLRKPIGIGQFTKVEKEEIKLISSRKIFIPNYIINKNSELFEPLMQKADFKYEVISNDDLNKKILNAKESFYYLVWNYNRSGSKYMSVIDGIDGKCVYNYWVEGTLRNSNYFNEQDIKKLNNFFK